jgi:hypothetical protein
MKLSEMTGKSRLELLNEQIAALEIQVQETTEAWTLAKSVRDPVQTKETEERLITLTTQLNALKMRRPV